MGRVFICHASRDADAVEVVARGLESAGTRCCLAPRDVAPGEDYTAAVLAAVVAADAVVFFGSASSYESPHCTRELRIGVESGRVIVPVILDRAPQPPVVAYCLSGCQLLTVDGPPASWAGLVVEAVSSALRRRSTNDAGAPTDPVEASGAGSAVGPPAPSRRRRRRALVSAFAATLVLAAAVTALVTRSEGTQPDDAATTDAADLGDRGDSLDGSVGQLPITDQAGRQHLVYVDAEGRLRVASEPLDRRDGRWSVRSIAGPPIAPDALPAATGDAAGRQQVFAVGEDGRLHWSMADRGGSWSDLAPLGGDWPAQASVAVAETKDGRSQVFAIGRTGSMYVNTQRSPGSTEWSGWRDLGGDWSPLAHVAAGRDGAGAVHVFVIGRSGGLYVNRLQPDLDQSSTGWENLGGRWPAEAALAVGRTRGGVLHVVAIASDRTIATAAQEPGTQRGWGPFESLGGRWLRPDGLAAGSAGGTALQLFVLGPEGEVFTSRRSIDGSTWSPFEGLGSPWGVSANIDVAWTADGRASLFIRRADGTVHRHTQRAADTSEWDEPVVVRTVD